MSDDQAKRAPRFLLARFERRVPPRIVERLPRRVLPDRLTALAVAACWCRSPSTSRRTF